MTAFSQHDSLKEHVLRHTVENPYLCDNCGRTFTTKPALQQHISIHTQEINHTLKKHNRKETFDKQYQCQICTMYTINPIAILTQYHT